MMILLLVLQKKQIFLQLPDAPEELFFSVLRLC